MARTRECCLCSQIEGREQGDLIARLLPSEPYARRIMLESGSFAVMPSLGPLVPGHSLLCPKAHVRSFAQTDNHLHAEYEEVKAKLKVALREIYGADVTLFEHGMAAIGDRILCTVDHAHMHFLPLSDSSRAGVARLEEWTEFDGSLATLRRLSGGREYIFYETPDGVCRALISHDEALESQYMRKVIAEGLGSTAHWNWRDVPDPKAADETWRHFIRS